MLQIWYNPQTAQPYMLIQTIQDIFKDCKGPDCGWWWWWRQERGTKAKRVAKKNKTQAEEGGMEARSERSWTKVRGGRGVMAREDGGGEKKKRARVKRRRAERRKGWEEWESAGMTMTEWASEGVWMKGRQKGMNPCGTQKETDAATSPAALYVCISPSLHLFLSLPSTFFSPVSLCRSLLSLAFFKTISHYSLVPPAFLHHPVCVRGEYVRVKTS